MGLAGAALVPRASAEALAFSPISQTVVPGGQATVGLEVDGLGNGVSPAISAFDITLFFDSTILSPNTVTFSGRLGDPDNPLETFTSNSFVLVGPTVVGIELSNISFLDSGTLFADQSTALSGFVLATITFDTLMPGTSSLTTFVGSAADENANSLSISEASQGSIQVSGGSSVPEPAMYAMSGVVLMLLAACRRIRRA